MYVPKDRVTNLHQGYGFVEFRSEEDADYVSDLHLAKFTEIIDILLSCVFQLWFFPPTTFCIIFLVNDAGNQGA